MSTPTSLQTRLAADLIVAARGRSPELGVLRLLKAALQTEGIAQGGKMRDLTEAQALNVFRRELKRRQESATIYEQAGRIDLAKVERSEAEVVSRYLPPPIAAADIAAKAKELALAQGLVGPKSLGQLTKALLAHYEGAIDGQAASAAARAVLATT